MNKRVSTIAGLILSCVAISAASANDDSGGRFAFQLEGFSARSGLAATPASEPVRSGRVVKQGKALGFDSGARGSVHDIIARHAAANGVPVALADAVVRIESRYNPRVSNGGALGLMQIKPATARGVGFAGSASALYNAETNVTYGMRYLAQAYRMSGGDTCATVMRYQSGHYANHMNAANRAYCSKARAIMASR